MNSGHAKAAADLPNRVPVWQALSELFLDTSFDDADRERLAASLASSPYSVAELQEILLWEVYPACRSNLFWIAGEWAGFDPRWLQDRILRGPSIFMRAWATTLGRLSVHSSLEWRRLRTRVQAKRIG
jgi:hypothetical protein